MKKTKIILLFFAFIISSFAPSAFANSALDISVTGAAGTNTNLNLNEWNQWGNNIKNPLLDKMKHESQVGVTGKWGIRGIKNFLYAVAWDLKGIFYVIAIVFYLILIIKLMASEKTEDEVANFKKWIIWTSVWLVVMQISYSFTQILYDRWINQKLAIDLNEYMVKPLLGFVETAAAFIFLAMMIFAFYKLVTANGNDDQVKQWRMTIVYSIIGFVVLKFSKLIVDSTYWKLKCKIFDANNNCIQDSNLEGLVWIATQIINWANGFIGIIVVLLIIYVWAKVIFSAGNSDTLQQAKTTIVYIFIGIGVLVMNYLILTFFLIPESPIIGG